MSHKIILETNDIIVKRGGATVLELPRLELYEGETLCLVGPNGAGKSTLLLTLATLARPLRGKMVFRGKSIGRDLSIIEYRRKLAMVFQEPLLFDTTVFNNVASGLRIRGIAKEKVTGAVKKQLERFHVPHLLKRSAKALSGGEAQRVSLARALALEPEILFLDEPFSALDPWSRGSLMADMKEVIRGKGITTVFATHSIEEALFLSDRVARMEKGIILRYDQPEEAKKLFEAEFPSGCPMG